MVIRMATGHMICSTGRDMVRIKFSPALEMTKLDTAKMISHAT